MLAVVKNTGLDLFSQLPPGNEAKTIQTTSDTLVQLQTAPSFGAQFSEVLRLYSEALDTYIASIRHVASLEMKFSPTEAYSSAVQAHGPYTRHELLCKVAKRIRGQLVRAAQNDFAPAGGSLSISEDYLDDKFPIEKWMDRSRRRDPDEMEMVFDPAACWNYLEATYGGQAGQELGYRQAAEAIVYEFSLRGDTEIKLVAGRTVLELRAYTEKRFNGNLEVNYTSLGSIHKAFAALATFATWADLDELAREFSLVKHAWTHSSIMTPRQRLALGSDSFYVTYKDKWLVHLSTKVAEQLQLFMGRFGGDQ